MKHKISALIVDDEERARRLLKKLLEETLFFNDIRLSHSAAMAIGELSEFDPDIIFLDIKMPGKDGFAFMSEFKQNFKKSEIVFVTAFEQYAIKAIKNQAFDYLLKPVNRKELKQCLTRFTELRKETPTTEIPKTKTEPNGKIPRIRVNTRNGTLFINPATIIYCKAEGNYTTICTGTKMHLCSMNIGKVKELLPGDGFIRVGRSYIINFEFITLLDRKESTLTLVRDVESVLIKIPRQHLKDFDIM